MGDFRDFAFESHTYGGSEYWSPVTSQRPSSTRAEMLAALLAIHADGPVHLAIDNANTVKGLARLIDGRWDCSTHPFG
eukprot:1456101-Alexandrium_andersonii.AAC.1